MNSRLAEIWLEEARRKPMTPAEMVCFYGRTKDHRRSQKGRFTAALAEALIALGQRVKPKNIAETGKPVYREKSRTDFNENWFTKTLP